MQKDKGIQKKSKRVIVVVTNSFHTILQGDNRPENIKRKI